MADDKKTDAGMKLMQSALTGTNQAKPIRKIAYAGGKPSPRIGPDGKRMQATGAGAIPVPTTPAPDLSKLGSTKKDSN